jgi:hypothetical protein
MSDSTNPVATWEAVNTWEDFEAWLQRKANIKDVETLEAASCGDRTEKELFPLLTPNLQEAISNCVLPAPLNTVGPSKSAHLILRKELSSWYESPLNGFEDQTRRLRKAIRLFAVTFDCANKGNVDETGRRVFPCLMRLCWFVDEQLRLFTERDADFIAVIWKLDGVVNGKGAHVSTASEMAGTSALVFAGADDALGDHWDAQKEEVGEKLGITGEKLGITIGGLNALSKPLNDLCGNLKSRKQNKQNVAVSASAVAGSILQCKQAIKSEKNDAYVVLLQVLDAIAVDLRKRILDYLNRERLTPGPSRPPTTWDLHDDL